MVIAAVVRLGPIVVCTNAYVNFFREYQNWQLRFRQIGEDIHTSFKTYMVNHNLNFDSLAKQARIEKYSRKFLLSSPGFPSSL